MLLHPALPRAAVVSMVVTVLTGAAVAGVLLRSGAPPTWTTTGLGAAVVTALLVSFPVSLPRRGGGLVIGLEPAVLVFLLITEPPRTAATWWLAGVVVGHLLTPGVRAVRHRVFNVALASTCGGAAAGILGLLGVTGPDAPGPRPFTLLAILLALLAALVIDVVVSGVQLTRELGTPLRPELRPAAVGLSALLLVSAGVLVHLGVLAHRSLPGWTLLLLLVPLATLVVVCRLLVERDRVRRIDARLHEAAGRFGGLSDVGQVVERLEDTAAQVLDHRRPVLRDAPPGRDEVGVPCGTGAQARWLVHHAPYRPGAARAEDRRALAALVLMADHARDRFTLAAEIAHGASHDALTGLLNRGGLVLRLQEALQQHPSGEGLGLVLLDLDDFRAVNDGLGPGAGDSYLVEVGRRLRDAVGEDDVISRFGGDEFAILVLTGGKDAPARTADRVLRALRRDHGGESCLVREIGASAGTTGWGCGEDATAVVAHADIALDVAKRSGKGTYREFSPAMLHDSEQRLLMVADLRRDMDTLQVHYQPVVDLQRGRVDGAEALVRWTRDGVDVPPSVFVPLAEECGLVDALGRRVLRQVITDLPSLQAAAGRDVSVAVNLSAHQLGDPALVELVREGVRVAGSAALLLEMTERVLIADDEETLAAVHRLTDTGALLVLDDFGAGYSAIAYLRRLPVRVVKIDRSIVAGVDHDPRRHDLVRGLVALCDAMGVTTLAEGVETEGEHGVVAELGCELSQGYLFGRPQPLDGFLRVLREHAGAGGPLLVPVGVVPTPRSS